MAYDKQLAERIRAFADGHPGLSEKQMFGGIAFLVNGNMACGVTHERLMVRVGPEGHDKAMARPHTEEMDFTGRPIRGMLFVNPEGYASQEDLKDWVERGLKFASSLPPKEATPSRRGVAKKTDAGDAPAKKSPAKKAALKKAPAKKSAKKLAIEKAAKKPAAKKRKRHTEGTAGG